MEMRIGRLDDEVGEVGRDGDEEKDVIPVQLDTLLPSIGTIVPVPEPGVEGLVSCGRLAAPSPLSPHAATLTTSTEIVEGVPS